MATEIDNQKRNVYEKIGKKFYDENRDNKELKEFEALFSEIEKLDKKQDELERAKLMQQGMRRCGVCRQIITIDSLFCNKCGAKQDKIEIAQPEQTVKQIEKRKCRNCNEILEKEAIFCPNCGSRQ